MPTRKPFDWVPPAEHRGRWSGVAYLAGKGRWTYLSHSWQNGRWVPNVADEDAGLPVFVRRLNAELPDLLSSRFAVLDVRVLSFSLRRFDKPEVLKGIAAVARRGLEKFEATKNRPPEISFEYATAGEGTFGVGWYDSEDSLSRPDGVTLVTVPGVERHKPSPPSKDDLAALLAPVRSAVFNLMPEIPQLDRESLPPRPAGRGRPSMERRADVYGLDAATDPLLTALEAVHDIPVEAVQMWLDRLAGQACPLLDENKLLVAKVDDVTERFGVKLFFPVGKDLVRVRLDAKRNMGAERSNPETPSAKAGSFGVRETTGGSVNEFASVPRLIAARDVEQAKRLWAERKRLEAE